jgi:hypothetical protein
MKKYTAILSIAILFTAGLALADDQTTWVSGNFRYTRVGDGVKVVQIHSASQPKMQKNTNNPASSSQFLNVTSASSIPDISVQVGTPLASINLPDTATVILSDKTTKSVKVDWDNGTPVYDQNTQAIYVFTGNLAISGQITNTNSVVAKVNVVVGTPTPISGAGSDIQSTTSPTDTSIDQTTSPTDEGNILQQAAGSLINGATNLFNFLVSPFKNLVKMFR